MLNDSGSEIEQKYLKDYVSMFENKLTNLKVHLSAYLDHGDTSSFRNFTDEVSSLIDASYKLSLNQIGDLIAQGRALGIKASAMEDKNKLFSVHSLLSQLLHLLDKILASLRDDQLPGGDGQELLAKKLQRALEQLEKHP
ncbi:MAG TPA: hypothetical protein VNJ01_02805 [Bacteriovoracaceae bacterium]|nr:hypothetical protein [Bacteriovoracaceae bacterium]